MESISNFNLTMITESPLSAQYLTSKGYVQHFMSTNFHDLKWIGQYLPYFDVVITRNNYVPSLLFNPDSCYKHIISQLIDSEVTDNFEIRREASNLSWQEVLKLIEPNFRYDIVMIEDSGTYHVREFYDNPMLAKLNYEQMIEKAEAQIQTLKMSIEDWKKEIDKVKKEKLWTIDLRRFEVDETISYPTCNTFKTKEEAEIALKKILKILRGEHD